MPTEMLETIAPVETESPKTNGYAKYKDLVEKSSEAINTTAEEIEKTLKEQDRYEEQDPNTIREIALKEAYEKVGTTPETERSKQRVMEILDTLAKGGIPQDRMAMTCERIDRGIPHLVHIKIPLVESQKSSDYVFPRLAIIQTCTVGSQGGYSFDNEHLTVRLDMDPEIDSPKNNVVTSSRTRFHNDNHIERDCCGRIMANPEKETKTFEEILNELLTEAIKVNKNGQ